jgi:hypothetical protein
MMSNRENIFPDFAADTAPGFLCFCSVHPFRRETGSRFVTESFRSASLFFASGIEKCLSAWYIKWIHLSTRTGGIPVSDAGGTPSQQFGETQ